MISAKTATTLAVLLAGPFNSWRIAQAQQTPSAGAPVSRPAEQVYANIKALNGLAYGEVIAGMQVMSEALGVACEHCHAESGDRDLEGNPNKDIARDMIRMTRELNEKQFGGRNVIGCNTCHRGRTVPMDALELAVPNEPKPATIRDARLPTVREVLVKYEAALGGVALRKVSSRVEQGTLTIRSSKDQQIPVQVFSQAPGQRRTVGFTVSHLGNSAQAFGVVNGMQGWMRESNGPVRLMFGWRRDAAQLEDLLNLPRRVEQLIPNLRPSRIEKPADREMVVLTGSTEYLAGVELFFDSTTGLLSRLVYHVDTTAGTMPSRIDYSDYREVDGVKVPFHWEVTLLRGVRVGYQLDSVKHNVPISTEQFALPSPPLSLYR